MTETFAPYAHTIVALALWPIVQILLSFAAVSGTPRAKTDSGHPVRDYSDPFYRRHRAFLNAQEAAAPFIAASVAAILAGASPFWVNLFASVFLVSRLATASVHILTEVQWLRSATWLFGFLSTIALAILALVGAFT
ncbi:MAG: MAPEG family protein [Pseudomonadota bacterium]